MSCVLQITDVRRMTCDKMRANFSRAKKTLG
jgi:hypothetical protein